MAIEVDELRVGLDPREVETFDRGQGPRRGLDPVEVVAQRPRRGAEFLPLVPDSDVLHGVQQRRRVLEVVGKLR
ncbi:MAG: hypothetical protein AAF602_32440, partial [Myxococcota bacterium]